MVYYKEVMHYADHTYEWLNQWSLPGIWVGCLFSLGWLRLMRWNVYRLIALALFVFALYAGGFYFFIDASISIDLLRISIICRGFLMPCCALLLCGVCMPLCRSNIFSSAFGFNVLHMLLGGLIGAALHALGLKYYVADGFARYSQYVDSVGISARHTDFSDLMQRLVEGLLAQAVK